MKKILRNTTIDLGLDSGAEMKTAIYTILRSARFQVVAWNDCFTSRKANMQIQGSHKCLQSRDKMVNDLVENTWRKSGQIRGEMLHNIFTPGRLGSKCDRGPSLLQ